MMTIGASCTYYLVQVEQTAAYRRGVPHATPRMPAFPWLGLGLGFAFGAANSECDFPNNCSLSLPFVRCIPEINTKAVILSILICLFFLLFIIMLAFISISLPLILINIGHLYD